MNRRTIPAIVSQYLDDVASLRLVRSVLVRAPHVRLLYLDRADERLLAALDGLSIAGDEGYEMAKATLDSTGVGQLFVVAALAIERRDRVQLDRLLALLEAVPDAARALASAFGWVSAPLLRGLSASLLHSARAGEQWLGIAACSAHRVDPGAALAAALDQPNARLRAQALRTAAQVGRVDLLPEALAHLEDADPSCQLAAAWSAVVLGDRTQGLAWLQDLSPGSSARQRLALQLSLLAADPATARRLVRDLVDQGSPLRTTLQAVGWAGDARAVPWLIDHMADDRHARAAGEAFSFLTGTDLAALDLERKPPQHMEGGPSEDPDDDNVALDEDESLPWPDQARVHAWWKANTARIPQGVRVLAGAAADAEQCARILMHGPQRQRHAAALLQCLARPGAVLFNVAAPSHRQRRLLADPLR